MNKPLLIQIAVVGPLAGVAVIFFVLGWWIPGVIAIGAALAAAFWMRRAVVEMRTDEAMNAAEQYERDNDSGAA